jgi:putative intracellular protease/amidase
VGAICHGLLPLARTTDPATGTPLLDGRHVTSLTAALETLFTRLVGWRRGRGYARTYPDLVETEVRAALGPRGTYETGPGRRTPFVVTDGVLVTARFPGDARVFAEALADLVQAGHAGTPRST